MLLVTAEEMISVCGGEPHQMEHDNWSDAGIRNGDGGYVDRDFGDVARAAGHWVMEQIRNVHNPVDTITRAIDYAIDGKFW